MRQTLNASGAVTASASYDPWGVPISGMMAPFGFTGELQDAAGQVYLRARWYNAGVGVFTARDSFAGFADKPNSLHNYAYVANNPVLYTDPSGRTWYLTPSEAEQFSQSLAQTAANTLGTFWGAAGGVASASQGLLAKQIAATLGPLAEKGSLGGVYAGSVSLGILGGLFGVYSACEGYNQDRILRILDLVNQTKNRHVALSNNLARYSLAIAKGIALVYVPVAGHPFNGGDIYALNRFNGSLFVLPIEGFFGNKFPDSIRVGLVAYNKDDVIHGFHFDTQLPLRVLPPVIWKGGGSWK